MTLKTPLTIKRIAEDSPSRASKRLKLKARKEEAVTISSTLFGCSDIVSELLAFLDTKSLLQFSCVNKGFSSLLTYEHIVRAAMMTGGYTAESLNRVISPIRDQMIWIPSPQRLLRLVSGKRCEKCCRSTRFVSPCTGLFLCSKCTVENTKQVYRGKAMNPYLDSIRVQRVPRKGPRSRHRFLIKAPMTDTTGEKIGPLVTLQDIDLMMKRKNTSMTARDKVAAHIEQCDARQPKALEARDAILSAFHDNRADATARKDAIRKAKLDGQKRFEEAKKRRVDEILVALKALVGDEVSWKSHLDDRTWMTRGNQYIFRDPVLHNVLVPLFKAPSKITKPILRSLPQEIQSFVDTKAQMDEYIQRIVDFVNDPSDETERAFRRSWNTMGFYYNFHCRPIAEILFQPLKDPNSLNEDGLLKLCNEVMSVLNRKVAGREVLDKLVGKLEGAPFKEDVQAHYWNEYSLAICFRRSHIQSVLGKPLLKPEDITEEKLNELVEQVRIELEKKQKVHRQVDLLLEHTRKYTKYTAWAGRINSWFWNSRDHKVEFHNRIARRVLNDKFADLDNLTDETIVELSKIVIEAFEKEYGNDATA